MPQNSSFVASEIQSFYPIRSPGGFDRRADFIRFFKKEKRVGGGHEPARDVVRAGRGGGHPPGAGLHGEVGVWAGRQHAQTARRAMLCSPRATFLRIVRLRAHEAAGDQPCVPAPPRCPRPHDGGVGGARRPDCRRRASLGLRARFATSHGGAREQNPDCRHPAHWPMRRVCSRNDRLAYDLAAGGIRPTTSNL